MHPSPACLVAYRTPAKTSELLGRAACEAARPSLPEGSGTNRDIGMRDAADTAETDPSLQPEREIRKAEMNTFRALSCLAPLVS